MTIGAIGAGIVVLVILWIGWDAYKTIHGVSKFQDEEDDTTRFWNDDSNPN